MQNLTAVATCNADGTVHHTQQKLITAGELLVACSA